MAAKCYFVPCDADGGRDALMCICIADGNTVWSGNSTATYMGQPSNTSYCTLLSNISLQLVVFSTCANRFTLTDRSIIPYVH